MRELLTAAACILALAVAGCRCPFFGDSCRIASFDCGGGRSIELSVDSFCDVHTFVYYEVETGGRVVAPKYTTLVGFSCGDWDEGTDPNAYRLVADASNNLSAVTFDDQGEEVVVLVYDFETETGYPRPERIFEIPPNLLHRLGLQL